MADTEKLRKAIEHFKFSSRPSNGDKSSPCTVGDIEKVVNNISKVLQKFVEELEE
jgi:hypothetical protein